MWKFLIFFFFGFDPTLQQIKPNPNFDPTLQQQQQQQQQPQPNYYFNPTLQQLQSTLQQPEANSDFDPTLQQLQQLQQQQQQQPSYYFNPTLQQPETNLNFGPSLQQLPPNPYFDPTFQQEQPIYYVEPSLHYPEMSEYFDPSFQLPEECSDRKMNLTFYMKCHFTALSVNGNLEYKIVSKIVKNLKQNMFCMNILSANMSSPLYSYDFTARGKYFHGHIIGHQSVHVNISGIECDIYRRVHAINKNLPFPWSEVVGLHALVLSDKKNCLWEVSYEDDELGRKEITNCEREICDENLFIIPNFLYGPDDY